MSSANIIEHSELIIGLIGGIGVDFDKIKIELEDQLDIAGYKVEHIRISDFFKINCSDVAHSFNMKYRKMQFGSSKRESKNKINNNNYWAKEVVKKILQTRFKNTSKKNSLHYSFSKKKGGSRSVK